jgi:hypothetical protein
MFRWIYFILLFSSIAIPVFAGKKPNPTLVKLPPAVAQIEGLKVPTPQQSCLNWAWAAAVDLMLTRQGVTDFKQSDWILKANGGEVCIDSPIDLNAVKKALDGDYVLLDTRKVHLQTNVILGTPRDMGYFIESLQNGRPLLVLLQGKPLVLQSIEYDEYIYPNNQRMYEARKLTLLDPFGGKPIVFAKLTDDSTDITGVLEVRVGPIEHFR